MLRIRCPWCGEREQSEFAYQGEAHLPRPINPAQLSAEEWGAYLFFRRNPKGWHRERWQHTAGCRRFFNALRDTRTDVLHATYAVGEAPPEPPASSDPSE